MIQTDPAALPSLTDMQMHILRPRKLRSVYDWARQYMRVTDGPLVGRDSSIPWSPEVFPPQETIVRAIDDKRWAKVVLMTAPQAFGKTQCAAIPMLLHAIHERRVNAIYVAASGALANTQWRNKIIKAIEAHPELDELLFENPDEGGDRLRRDFTNGTSIHIVGSESVGHLSGKTVAVLVCDDVHAYGTLPNFGHPADVAAERLGAFPPKMVTQVFMGTASVVDDWLWQNVKSSAYYCPFLPCPHCGTFQLLEWDRMEIVRGGKGNRVGDRGKTDARLRCANADCGKLIRFEDLPGMLTQVLWASCPPDADWVTEPPEGGVTIDPVTADVFPNTHRNSNVAGFWSNALYWPWGASWNERAAAFENCKGKPDEEKNFYQNTLVVPQKPPDIDEERLTTQEIASHAINSGYAAGTVPDAADLVTETVDVQSGHIYWLARAWRKADGESWLIDLGTIGRPTRGDAARRIGITAALDEADAIAAAGWDVVDPNAVVVGHIFMMRGAVDLGYERDTIASWWWRKHRRVWFLIRGAGAGKNATIWPRKPSLDKHRIPFRFIDVNQCKHQVRQLQRIPEGQAGYQHLPSSGLHPNTIGAYVAHMASERFNRERKPSRWEQITPGKPNHFWDCEVYQIAMAIACGVKLPTMMTRVVIQPTKGQTPKRRTDRRKIRRRYG